MPSKGKFFILSFAGRGGSGFFVTLPFLLHGRETIHGMAMIQGEQVQDSELSTQAVIYLGPSSMSLMVAEAVRDRIRLLDFLQQPVPMARDIFRFHRISRHTMDRCVQIIGDYLEILKEYGAGSKLSVRFMISNIISEADNVDVFVNRMHVAHGLRGRRIDDGKMTRLIYVKVQEALAQYPGFSKKKVLVVHTGPGNTRVLLFQKGRIVRYSCYRLGTHRTGEAVGEIEYGDDVAELSILREHMRGQVDQICLDYGGVKGLAGLIVIGQEMQQLRDRLAPTPEGKVACSSLAAEAERMSRTTLEQRGGDVTILPTPNPEQLSLFRQGKLDGVWTVEPWVSRLVLTAGGRVLVDEKESIATVLVCGAEFLREKPEVAKALVQAHEELNEWIRLHPDEAQLIVVRELEELTHSRIDPALIAEAWKSIVIKDRISIPKLRQFVQDAHQAGFMKEVPDIGGLVVPEAAEEQLTMAKEAGGR